MTDREPHWPRIILHADMDAFFAAVEQRDHPELRGKPIVIGSPSKRGVVSTASYEARPYGLKSAMPMVEAMRRCPHVIVVRPNFSAYQEASDRIMEVFENYSPAVEPLSLDEAFVDMSGAQQIFGSPREMAHRVKTDVLAATGLTISVGVATVKYVAKVASDFQKPDGLTVVNPGTERAFLWPMSVSRLWGVGPRSKTRIEEMGLNTIGDVARSDPAFLEAKLGSLGRHIWELANARDERTVEARGEAKSVGKEFTMEQDVVGEQEIWPLLRRGADQVARSLRHKGLAARGVRVKLKTNRFKLITRQAPLDPAADSARELLEGARGLLGDFDLSVPMRLVGIAAFNLVRETGDVQGDLFADPGRARTKRLDRALDQVIDKFGSGAVKRGSDIE